MMMFADDIVICSESMERVEEQPAALMQRQQAEKTRMDQD